eukprot:gnl/MRDRNA2_/MRDRNA2_35289_c0_seq1.p1 gnl/MRDRNA2_/MRDRNA2_35289_c0~~gnl/MRDRNA2_/MRDRNA2_35289_c0_seq1.p1  ORF type:complete len:575 (+),score=16.76 gnl/MRDRNA2_/MRDRNA2_35289_c0_seq1:88-1725(+)
MSDGQAVNTLGHGTPGDDLRSNELVTDGVGASRTYKARTCNERILIWKKPANWVNPPPSEIWYDLTITKGAQYATLDNTPKDQTRVGCQTAYRQIPDDTHDGYSWQIAKDDFETMSQVDSYPWGTHILVIAGGKAIRTTAYQPAGEIWNSQSSGCLNDESSKYKPCCCDCKVLMKRLTNQYKGADPQFRRRRTPSNIYWYEEEKAWFATLDDTTKTSSSQGCYTDDDWSVELYGTSGYKELSAGWQIAPSGDGSREVAADACWGTYEVVIRGPGTSGYSVRTGCANNPGEQNTGNSLNHVDYDAVRFYKPNSCNKRILIMKPGPGYTADRRRRRRTDTIKHNGCEYATTDFAPPESSQWTHLPTNQVIPTHDQWAWAPCDTDAVQAAQAANWGAHYVNVGVSTNGIGIKTQLYGSSHWWQSWIGNSNVYFPGSNFYWIWSIIETWLNTGHFHNNWELAYGRWRWRVTYRWNWHWWVGCSLPWDTGYPQGQYNMRRRVNEWRPLWWGARILIRKETSAFQAHRRRASQTPWFQNAHHSVIRPGWWR